MQQGRFELLDQHCVVYGARIATALVEECAKRGAQRVFIATTNSLRAAAETLARALSAQTLVFSALPAHSPMPAVFDLARAISDFRPDCVVALGGGSVIDAVKVASLILCEEIGSKDALIARSMQKGGVSAPRAAPVRYVAAPTTLSGAEFGVIGGAVDPDAKIKYGFSAPYFCAHTIVFDPWLAQDTPMDLWLSSGVRALDHALEGFLSPDANPFVDGCSIEGARLLATSLRATKAAPQDVDARAQSQAGLWLAAQGVGRVRYGASHGIGHQLGAVAGVPHGVTSCVMLPAALQWNLPATRARQEKLAAALGAEDLAAHIRALVAALGLPGDLRAAGVRPEQYEQIAQLAMANPFVQANPRRIETPQDILAILKLAE